MVLIEKRQALVEIYIPFLHPADQLLLIGDRSSGAVALANLAVQTNVVDIQCVLLILY